MTVADAYVSVCEGFRDDCENQAEMVGVLHGEEHEWCTLCYMAAAGYAHSHGLELDADDLPKSPEKTEQEDV